ncbi:MAG: endonuclease/exonuclease/phosphatase family protein [Tannerellaceae bacterium]|jgi:endonuclease/exonuclease/phosphatase family metal-dependent hydrolase|nr:endonuclease/exonuclease/phosphatase family protein [Tannerellaceae bacterium]
MRGEILKNIIKYIFVIANVLTALLFIASAFSDRVPPEKSLFFSYLGLIFPFICLLNVFFIIYWLLFRSRKYTLIGIITFILCWQSVCSYFPLHFKNEPTLDENIIKVLTYNVMGFAYKDHTEKSPNEIIKYIAESNADIVCMQEYYFHKSRKGLNITKLNKALSMYPYRSVVLVNKSNWGLAVYSKYPISNSRRIDYKSKNNGSSIHEIDINGKKLTLINNHLESFKLTMEDKTRYSDFIKGVGAETFDILKGTIQQKLGPAYLIRAKQARAIAKEIQNTKSDYLLVCGDFNDTPISYAHRTIQGTLLDAFAESGRGLGVTYNQNFFWFRIDNILHSSNMQAIKCQVGKVKYSDHYPLWCYFKLTE